MSANNAQLYALVESMVAYAISKDWKAEDVYEALEVCMEPMHAHEKEKKIARLAEGLTLSQAQDIVINSMGICWSSTKMERLFAALKRRFPKHHKSIDNIEQWAGDASDVNPSIQEDGCEEEYTRLAGKAMLGLSRLPWPKK